MLLFQYEKMADENATISERGSDEEEISINLPRSNLAGDRTEFLERLNLLQGGNVRRTLSFQSQSSTSSQTQRSSIMSESQHFSGADNSEAGNSAADTSQQVNNDDIEQEGENQNPNAFQDLRDMEVHKVQWTETTRRKRKLVVDGYR